MSNKLWKSFNLCFSKFRCLPIITFTPPLTIQEDNKQDDKNSTPPPTINNPSAVTITTFNNENSTAAASMDDYDMHDSIPDFSSALASHRFFFSTPGSSNSIFDQPRPLKDSSTVMSGGVAVQKFTLDPYADFRKSIQEMIEAHEWTDVKSSVEFLHELLLCYLTLNPKHTHKLIIDAFADSLTLLCPPCRSRGDAGKPTNSNFVLHLHGRFSILF